MYQTPLDMALEHDHKSLAAFLRTKGARPGPELSLHAAAAACDLNAVKKHFVAGTDINALVKGERPLCVALAYQKWNVANFLLNRKCDVTTQICGKDEDGRWKMEGAEIEKAETGSAKIQQPTSNAQHRTAKTPSPWPSPPIGERELQI